MWSRRAFLATAGAGFLATLTPARAEALSRTERVFASAVIGRSGGYAAALLTADGTVLRTIDLPARGHDVTLSPDGARGVVFARRPGTFALVFDPSHAAESKVIASPENRHFFGHGAFSDDGRLLYASENDIETDRGLVGVYDVAGGFRRVGEFETGGIGPHEILMMADGRTLAVANGGVETNPAYGRALLNVPSMEPSLAFIDTRGGSLLGTLRLARDLHQLSIRHLALDSAGRVWFGCQFLGPGNEHPQLVGVATREGGIDLVPLPQDHLGRLRNFIGSLASSADKDRIAVSSPEGGAVLVIDAGTRDVVASIDLIGGGGIAPAGAGFLASSGRGTLARVHAGKQAPVTEPDFTFDSHLRAVPA